MAKRASGDHAQLPTVKAFEEPILKALRTQGGSASVREMLVVAARELGLDTAQLAIPHDAKRGSRSEVSYRMAWARTKLRAQGLIEPTERARWTLTDKPPGK